MNCSNHPEQEVSAYCQNCGKPLCSQCVRSVAGVVYCEPCLAAKLGGAGVSGPGASAPGATGTASSWTAHDPRVAAAAYTPTAAPVAPMHGSASPVLAGFLGLIPGVGAMYNGQFIKALIHVLVFVALIGVARDFDPAGILVFIWIVYQVFDAAQTASARRDGRPVPDPIGLNALVDRMGIPGQPIPVGGQAYGPAPAYGTSTFSGSGSASTAGYTAVPQPDPSVSSAATGSPADPSAMPPPPPGASWQEYVEHAATAKAMQDAGIPVSGAGFRPGPGYPSVPPPAYPPYAGRPDATGPIVLIVVGALFLLSTLGIFRIHWLGHLWPVFIIVLGAFLLFRRVRSTPPTVPPTYPPAGGAL